jgi:hypothetical protein
MQHLGQVVGLLKRQQHSREKFHQGGISNGNEEKGREEDCCQEEKAVTTKARR